MFIVNPISRRRRARRGTSGRVSFLARGRRVAFRVRRRNSSRNLPAWVRALSKRNPSMSKTRRHRRRKARRGGFRRLRTNSRRRMKRNRKGRFVKRSRSKARRNPRRRRYARRYARRNPGRRSSYRRRGRRYGRKHIRRRRRNPSGILRSLTRSVTGVTKTGTWKSGLRQGFGMALGFAGVNALGSIENRYLLAPITERIPGGFLRTLWDYGLKLVNTAIAANIAGMLPFRGRSSLASQVRLGGYANLGVRFLGDLAGLMGEPGAQVQSYLSGLSDYLIVGPPGATAFNPGGYGLGNYMTAAGSPIMPDYVGIQPYGDSASMGY